MKAPLIAGKLDRSFSCFLPGNYLLGPAPIPERSANVRGMARGLLVGSPCLTFCERGVVGY